MNTETCKDWNPFIEKGISPRVLLIGHDPRLQSSDTIAEYALFSDYYFKDASKARSEKRKLGLAQKSFEQVLNITNYRYKAEEIYVTNLCNVPLDHSPKGKTVLIPESRAKEGIDRISGIIRQYDTIECVFPMSLQVNYWLQHFGFYHSSSPFLSESEPKNDIPYYEPKKKGSFLQICGNVYELESNRRIIVIPILHTKQYGRLTAYFSGYEKIKDYFIKMGINR